MAVSTVIEKIEVYQADGTTLRQTWSVSNKGLAIKKEIPWQDTLTYEHVVPGGFGNASFTIFKDEETITAQLHDVVKIYWDGTKRYEGRVSDLQKVLNEDNPNSDATRFTCRNMINNDTDKLTYDLREANNGKVSTNIDDIYRDAFLNNKFVDKGQDFNIGVTANSNVTFADASVLPSLTVNAYYRKASLINVIQEQIVKANGTLDLTSVEPYQMYIKGDNSVVTKQREDDTTPLATFALDTGVFRVKHSVDLEDYSADIDTNIINQIIINDVDYTTSGSQYETEISASQSPSTGYGIKIRSFDQSNLHTDRIQEWVDGKILNLLEPLTTYRIRLRKTKYSMAPVWFNGSTDVPDGYVKITGTTGGDITAPFKRCVYRSTTSGFEQVIELGEYRPNLDLSVLSVAEPIADVTPSLLVSFVDNEVDEDHAPATFECSAPNGFKVRIDADAQELSGVPVVKVASVSKTVTYNATEGAYLTVDIPRPTIGDLVTVETTATNNFGKDLTAFYYVKGVEVSKGGVPVTAFDHDTSAGDSTTSAQEYTDKITIQSHYKDRYYTAAAQDVDFKIYNIAGSLVKTLTHVSSPAVVESPANSGNFIVTTTVSALGLAYGFYDVVCELTRHENFIDRDGTPHDHTEVIDGPKFRIRLIAKTVKDFADDHETRLPPAEQESNIEWNDGFDDFDAQLKFFSTSIPDGGGEGWFVTKNKLIPGNWIRVASDQTGTPDSTFTINNDDTAGQYVYLVFSTDSGTDIGQFRYDKTNKKMEVSVNNGSTWQDVATGVNDAIQNTIVSTVYKLRVDDTTGDLIFNDGTNNLFKVSTAGTLTVYSDIVPDTDDSYDLGSNTKKFANAYIGNVTYTQDIIGTPDGGTTVDWEIEWDGVNSIAIPHHFAIGFMDG